ncbi:MAG: DUF4332 domain-containing protein [Halobacteriales archaeon]|nr:DUF4332 domain-containing protein [Halobacteriales archaeon]
MSKAAWEDHHITYIDGIGEPRAITLNRIGIVSTLDLASAPTESVAAAVGGKTKRAEAERLQAMAFLVTLKGIGPKEAVQAADTPLSTLLAGSKERLAEAWEKMDREMDDDDFSGVVAVRAEVKQRQAQESLSGAAGTPAPAGPVDPQKGDSRRFTEDDPGFIVIQQASTDDRRVRRQLVKDFNDYNGPRASARRVDQGA